MLVRDNQQATIDWFVGILEGEGCFGLPEKGNNPIVRITNTDEDLIQTCEFVLQKHSILYSRYEDRKKTKGGKTAFRLYISGVDCNNLYNLIGSRLQCRREEFRRIVGASETLCSPTASLDWLVGIWQAEGTFFISRDHKGNLRPQIVLNNTNLKIIEKIVLSLRSLGCSWYCKNFVPTVNKPYTRILIYGFCRCQRFLIKTKNLWFGKRDSLRSSLMLEYIQSRLSKSKKEHYSEKEMQLYHRLKQLNS